MRAALIASLLAALIAAPPLYGDTNPYIAGCPSPGAADAYCDACPDDAGGADQLCEQPDGTSDGLCGWTIVETNADVDMAAARPSSYPCTDQTNYAIKFSTTSTSTSEAKIYKSASGSVFYIQGFVYPVTIPAGETLYAFTLSDTSNSPSVRVRIVNTGGDIIFSWGYHEASGWTDNDVLTALSLNTWYAFRLYISNSTTDTIQFWVDLNGDGDFSDAGETQTAATGKTLDRATARYMAGTAADVTSVYSFYLAGIKVDDDTMPDMCSR